MTTINTQLPVPWPKRLRHIARRILRFVLILFLAISVVFYLLQEKLIFQGATTQGTKEAIVNATPGMQILFLTTPEGEHVAAIFGRAQTPSGQPVSDPAHAPTILFFYGNAECMNDTLNEFRDFRRLGANVIIPEYLGYGMSGGKPGETGCYAAADAAWHWLETQHNDFLLNADEQVQRAMGALIEHANKQAR